MATGRQSSSKFKLRHYPLRNAWQHMKRYRQAHKVHAEWLNDFLQFVNDVGERPSSKHKLYAADDTKPLGPDNFVWKTAITSRAEGEDEATYRRRRLRVYRALEPERYKNYDLKKLFGLSKSEYAQMLAEHGEKCAICGEPETLKIKDKTISLSVDHCHGSGKVRGLLCSSCNTGIGLFKDSPAILRAAISYLEKFR